MRHPHNRRPTRDNDTPEQSEVLVSRDGSVVTLTFNRPEAATR